MLTELDRAHLESYDKRLTIIRERTRQVAKFANGERDGARTGYYIHGGPGTGKTYLITGELNGQRHQLHRPQGADDRQGPVPGSLREPGQRSLP